MQIFIQKDGQQSGPYTLDQVNEYLAQDSLQATDPAWHKELADWCPLDQIDGVVVADSSSPPPFDPNTFKSTGRPQHPSRRHRSELPCALTDESGHITRTPQATSWELEASRRLKKNRKWPQKKRQKWPKIRSCFDKNKKIKKNYKNHQNHQNPDLEWSFFGKNKKKHKKIILFLSFFYLKMSHMITEFVKTRKNHIFFHFFFQK